jgi:chemotaxis protein histidine kinase CheA
MAVDLQKYRALFFQEADHFHAQMHEGLDKKDISTLHRLSHSMKSRSLIMGYTQLGHMGKALELYFRDIDEGKKLLPTDLNGIIEPVMDHIKMSLEDIKVGKPEHDLTAFITSLE